MTKHHSSLQLKGHYVSPLIDPLTSVRAIAELLRDYPDLDAGQQRRFLDIILDSTDRLIHLADCISSAETTLYPSGP